MRRAHERRPTGVDLGPDVGPAVQQQRGRGRVAQLRRAEEHRGAHARVEGGADHAAAALALLLAFGTEKQLRHDRKHAHERRQVQRTARAQVPVRVQVMLAGQGVRVERLQRFRYTGHVPRAHSRLEPRHLDRAASTRHSLKHSAACPATVRSRRGAPHFSHV